MQRPDEKKRQKIIATAAKLFTSRPFHEVRLEDVAAAAGVGKGTVYIYFKSKEDLYVSLIHDGFARLLEQLTERMTPQTSPDELLESVVRLLAGFAVDHPEFFDLMRVGPLRGSEKLLAQGRKVTAMLEGILRRGIEQGMWVDPNPALTAVYIPGLVRSAMLYGPPGLKADALAQHMLGLLRQGLTGRAGRAKEVSR